MKKHDDRGSFFPNAEVSQSEILKYAISLEISQRNPETVLDVGGGTGWLGNYFDSDYYVLDKSKDAFENRKTDNFYRMDVLEEVPDRKFDLVIGVGVLKYFCGKNLVRKTLENINKVADSALFFVGSGFTSYEYIETDFKVFSREFYQNVCPEQLDLTIINLADLNMDKVKSRQNSFKVKS